MEYLKAHGRKIQLGEGDQGNSAEAESFPIGLLICSHVALAFCPGVKFYDYMFI